jgi:hypothetical protein
MLKCAQEQEALFATDSENADLYLQLQQLDKQYQALSLSKEYNLLIASSANQEHIQAIKAAKLLNTQMRNVIAQLKSFTAPSQTQMDSTKTVVELYYSPTTKEIESSMKLITLENRLRALENKVGNWNRQVILLRRSI